MTDIEKLRVCIGLAKRMKNPRLRAECLAVFRAGIVAMRAVAKARGRYDRP